MLSQSWPLQAEVRRMRHMAFLMHALGERSSEGVGGAPSCKSAGRQAATL